MNPPPDEGSLRGAAYDRVMRTLRAASPFVGSRAGAILFAPDSKVAEGVRGRREAARVLIDWGNHRRDRTRSLAWFHAPSVGEGLQARAVMEALAEARPDLQLVFTFFSPSARGLAAKMPARVAGYLPWDTRDAMEPVLDALEPSLVVFTKTEVWPGLSAAAARRGIPTALVAGTLPADAGRLRWPGPPLLRPAFGRLARVGAISREDGDRFGRLGVASDRITVTGDPGIDSAAERAEGADPDSSYLAPFLRPTHPTPPTHPIPPTRPTLIAGSTWAPDEDVLVPALAAVRAAHPELRTIIAPHEPDEEHLRRLESRLARHGFTPRRLAGIEAQGDAEGADIVIVDRVGVLAHLYKAGNFSYVGGGFHRHGLHSVLEPAAAKLPVLVGPRFSNSLAAHDLVRLGGARVVSSSEEIREILTQWLQNPGLGDDVAGTARAYIQRHRGAAEATAAMLTRVMAEQEPEIPS